MKLAEAIEIGIDYLKGSDKTEPVEFNKFVQLGIEALKLVQLERKTPYSILKRLLPGETEEARSTIQPHIFNYLPPHKESQ